MRPLALILFLFAAVAGAAAGPTNYFCVVCGRGPLTGRLWLSKWGPVCEDCYRLENHCSLCGLPVRADDGSVKTGDGRFICRFDRTNAVLDVAGAREVFADVRRDLVELFGQGFALKFPDVTVNLFDVDYWSEQGREDHLHKFGFAYTRQARNGDCTHEVVLLSGRLRTEIAATAAHEYTHLWINENRPAEHVMDDDTTEAICELSAYKLMQAHAQPAELEKILDNPYTHGEIKTLVALEQERGIGSILDWVKNGTTAKLAPSSPAPAATVQSQTVPPTNARHPLPTQLSLGGLLFDGRHYLAILNNVSFAMGETKSVRIGGRSLQVHCREINADKVVLELAGRPEPVTLTIGEGKFAP